MFTGKKLSPGSTYSALNPVSIENGPLDTKSKTYLELAMLRELLLANLKLLFQPKTVCCFLFPSRAYVLSSWLLAAHPPLEKPRPRLLVFFSSLVRMSMFKEPLTGTAYQTDGEPPS